MTAAFRGSSSGVPRTRLRGPGYQRLTRDVFVLTDRVVDLRTRIDGALLVFPNATVCLWTAAAFLKLPVPDDGIVHLDRGHDAPRTKRDGMKTHRLAIPDKRIHVVDEIRLADGPRCFADLSAHLELEGLVALGDVVARRWKPDEIADAVADHRSKPGAVLLRQAVPLLDGRSGSPAETRARLRVHAAGFTDLVHGVVITDEAGQWIAEPDLADRKARVALQHEGEVHFLKGVQQRRHDVERDDLSRAENWEVVVSTALDDARPHRLLTRLEAAYRRAGDRWGRHVLPPHLR